MNFDLLKIDPILSLKLAALNKFLQLHHIGRTRFTVELQDIKVMSFATPNYAPYRARLAMVNSARVLEASLIRRIIRGSKGHDLI